MFDCKRGRDQGMRGLGEGGDERGGVGRILMGLRGRLEERWEERRGGRKGGEIFGGWCTWIETSFRFCWWGE